LLSRQHGEKSKEVPMKHRFFLALAALAALAGPALGDPAARTLTMSGQGEVKAAPDTVTLSAGVTVQAPTAAAALAADNTRMQGVMAALKKQGVADKNIQTAQFSVSPQYASSNDGQAPRLTGYQVTNEVSVRLDDVTKLGATLDALVAAGANQMNGINFSIADSSALLTEARQRAVTEALAKAQTYAKAAGVTLGPILSISENENSGPRPMFMTAMAVRAPKAVPVAMGEESVTANVSIVWQIQ
jgi:uncharacterized protein YggE